MLHTKTKLYSANSCFINIIIINLLVHVMFDNVEDISKLITALVLNLYP